MEQVTVWQGNYCGGFLQIFQDEPYTVSYAFIGNEFEMTKKLRFDIADGSTPTIDDIFSIVEREFNSQYEEATLKIWNIDKAAGVVHAIH